MNREIKFRGKDRENWHYGDLVQEIRHNDNKLFDGTMTHIRNFEYKNGSYIGDSFPVNSETIGKYTGLHDKNGKEIYEGDIYSIIKYDIDDIGHKEIHTVKFDEILCRFNVNKFDSEAYEVIGNIYENSELLEEEI